LQYINAYLEPYGYRAMLFDKLPQKLLAVHSGLGLYGRNNLCFHKEFGSYIRILSFISDLPVRNLSGIRHDEWIHAKNAEPV
jgi:epoxyqueuosine reductase QueG